MEEIPRREGPLGRPWPCYSKDHQFVAAINGSIYFPMEKYILSQQFSYRYDPDKC